MISVYRRYWTFLTLIGFGLNAPWSVKPVAALWVNPSKFIQRWYDPCPSCVFCTQKSSKLIISLINSDDSWVFIYEA